MSHDASRRRFLTIAVVAAATAPLALRSLSAAAAAPAPAAAKSLPKLPLTDATAKARDGLLPRVFAKVHPKFHTPWVNTIVVGLITAIAAAFFDINTLGDMTSVGTLAAFGIVCMSVIWLRRSHPEIPRGFKVPLYPVLPAFGIVACFALIFTVEARVLIFFAWYLLAAVVMYFVYGLRNSQLQKGLQQHE